MRAVAATLLSRPRARRRALSPRVLLIGVAALVLLAGYFLYLRDSSFVAVTTVNIRGVDAGLPGSDRLRGEIERASGEMTTLHVKPELVDRAVSDYPLVRSVSVDAAFPHTLDVVVDERRPVAVVGAGADEAVVAEDGVMLPDLSPADLHLPDLAGPGVPRGRRLSGHALEAARVLGAAPRPLVPYLGTATYGRSGVAVVLTSGIELRFGDASSVTEKWKAAAGVLADQSLTVLDYVDLTSPSRPAVGGAGHSLPGAP